jgi:hypothetical protein
MKKRFVYFAVFILCAFSYYDINSTLDLEKFVKEVYNLYQTDEVAAKKERLVYKKLSDLISETVYTMKITCSDSIAYDRKEDKSVIKSKEVYHADTELGYFGVFLIIEQKGDDLLMKSSPDKDMSVSGKITDIIVLSYRKGMNFVKTHTPLKEFDDSGTIIQQVILKVQM